MRISKRQVQIYMAKSGLNIKKLAERTGMKPQNLSTVLTRETCRPDTAIRIADALGVEAQEIIKGE